jgi:dUTP pyrophosphatase
MEMKFKKTHPEAFTPSRAKPGDSGLDLYACAPRSSWVKAGEHAFFNTGIAIELPEGFEAQVRPRSGLATRYEVIASFGTVDNGYRGPIGVTLFNLSKDDFLVRHGDRIAQLVVAPVVYPMLVEVDELSDTERGSGGFGSTGV